MTNHHITDVLASIGEAKRALDAEPSYQARIRELEHKLLIDGQTIAAREQRIHELKQSEESLTAKLRSVEAERDDAGFRLLEESDRVSALSSHLRQVITDSLKLLEVAGGEPQQIVTTAQLKAKDAHIADLEQANDIEHEATRIAATNYDRAISERDEAIAALHQLREAIAPKPIDPPPGGQSVPEPTPEPSTVEAYERGVATDWAERVPDPMPSLSYGSVGSDGPFANTAADRLNVTATGTSSNPLSTTSLTPVGEVPAADPFAPKANTGSPSVSSPGASESRNAFWPDSSNH